MAKKEKEKKSKKSGRKPTLAKFVDAPFKLYGKYKGKEHTAQVLGTGVIVLNDEEYATPSGAAVAITKKPTDGYIFWRFNKDGERVPLDAIRGGKGKAHTKPNGKEATHRKTKSTRKAKPSASVAARASVQDVPVEDSED